MKVSVVFLSLIFFAGTQLSAQDSTRIAIKKLTPNLIVEDVNAVTDFYVNKLGFTAILTLPDTGKFDFSMVVSDSTTIMFQAVNSLKMGFPEYDVKSAANSVILYIDVADIEAVRKKCQENNIPIIREVPRTFYGTTEFVIKDNAGHFVVFAMDLPQ